MRKLDDILAEQNRPDDRDLRSRTDARKERKSEEERLARLAEELVQLSAHKLSSLALPGDVLEAVLETQRIASAAARNRQLRIVRRTLRENDSEAIRRRMEGLVHPQSASNLEVGVAAEWAARLLAEGDEALGSFLSEHPEADRRRLRQLVRHGRGAPAGDRVQARRALLEAIADALGL